LKLLADFIANVAVVGMELFQFALKYVSLGSREFIMECGGCDAALGTGNCA